MKKGSKKKSSAKNSRPHATHPPEGPFLCARMGAPPWPPADVTIGVAFVLVFAFVLFIPMHSYGSELISAARSGDALKVGHLINKGVNIDETEKDGMTPLWIASAGGYTDIVKLLITAKADVNLAENNGMTPLGIASAAGHTDIVRQLIRAKADVNAATTSGVTPLYMASAEGRTDIVKQLITARADVNLATKSGATPLFAASAAGHADIVHLLMEAGAK
ncbi:MAG: ankyrin repeat domain-containing protein [Nitrospiria bacterium]